MTEIVPLRRIADLSGFEESFARGEPVVVTGAARSMPAFERWTDEHLIAAFGESKPEVRLEDGKIARLAMSSFLHYLEDADSFQSKRGRAYLTDYYVRPSFEDPVRAKLAPDTLFPLPRRGEVAEWVTLYAGPAGTGSPMHQDVFSTHTWLAELRGRKAWRMCAPSDLDDHRASQIDAFGDAMPACPVYEAVLDPGDLIYLPPDWWHQVRNLTATIALSGNFCSFDRARSALAEARLFGNDDLRRRWLETWTEILSKAPDAAGASAPSIGG